MRNKIRNTLGFAERRLLYLYISSVIIYVGLNWLLPVDPTSLHKYHLTTTQAKLLETTIFIPIILIWFAALYGYEKLRAYSTLIKRNKDGIFMAKVSQGLLVSAIGLPVTSIVTTILNYMALKYPNFTPSSRVINHYLSLAIALVTFLIISTGTRGLSDMVKGRPSMIAGRMLIFLFTMLSSLYCYVAFSDPARQKAAAGAHQATYYLPDWLLLTTIVAPYLFVWFIGLVSALEIYYYKHRISGILYRKSFTYVALGLALVILSSITIQFLASLSTFINELSFKGILLVIYLFLIVYAAGYVFIAAGAKKLIKIEEV